jgi:putative aminopeptidase FrvX
VQCLQFISSSLTTATNDVNNNDSDDNNSNNILKSSYTNGIDDYFLLNQKQFLDKLPFTLYLVNSVQEEIGLRGAEMISRRLQPDVAIITDVTHDTHSPLYNKKIQGDCKCGKGAVVTYGPAVQNNLLQLIIGVAKDNEIAIQRNAVSRSTGTDTDSFAYSGMGVASALISLPLKYMHTTVETVHQSDIESCIQLMYQSVKTLKAGQQFNYL